MCNNTDIKIICLGALLLPVVMTVGGCKKQPAQFERPPALVTTANAISRDVPVYLDEIGSCTASEVVSIHPQVSGQIMEVHFTDGADLKKGDRLFTIDPRTYQAALSQAKAAFAQNQATLTLAKTDFERAKKLLPEKAISQEDYDTRQNALAVARAQIQAGKAAVETAQVNLDYCFITSPIDGLAGQKLVDVGNIVTGNSNIGNSNPLLVIQQLDPIHADFTIAERNLALVREKMSAGTLKTQVWLPGESEVNAPQGDLTFLDNAIQNNTGTIKLRATLPNSNRHFWPGQFVRVRLVLSIIRDAVLIPSSAPQLSQSGTYVYVISPDNTAELRLVKLGQKQGNLVVVTEGLEANEKVVTSGQLMVTPNGKVREKNSSPQNQQGDSSNASL